jgi:putative transposase
MPLTPQDLRTFFITSVAANRRRLFQVESTALLLMEVLSENRQKGRLALHAFVLMPGHIHLILTPAPEISLEKAMQFIKGGFSFRLKDKQEVWEKSFKEHRIKDRADYRDHLAYVENNPVRKSIVFSAKEYPYSSASRPELIDPIPGHFV